MGVSIPHASGVLRRQHRTDVRCGRLIVYAGLQQVAAFSAPDHDIGRALLNSVGYMVIAVAVFEVAKYILEEEVISPLRCGTPVKHAVASLSSYLRSASPCFWRH